MIGPTRCVCCRTDHYFTSAPPTPMWAPCLGCDSGSHFVCNPCVGGMVAAGLGRLCPASDEVRLALELMGRR